MHVDPYAAHIHAMYVHVQRFSGCGQAVRYMRGIAIASMQLGMYLVFVKME